MPRSRSTLCSRIQTTTVFSNELWLLRDYFILSSDHHLLDLQKHNSIFIVTPETS
jgi:hypothetical protein